MDIKDLVKLVDAGFTPAQIEKLIGEKPESSAEPEPQEAPAEQPKPAPAVQPAPAPAPVKQPDPEPEPAPKPIQVSSNEALLKELKELRLAIQAGNINQGGPGPKQESVEDVLASIIAP